jgi:hypothetical protein
MAGGVELLRLTFALLVLIKFSLLFGAYRQLGKNTLLACGGLVVVALLNFSTFGVIRPQQVGEICFSLLLLALGQAQLSRRTLALLALLFIFWVNAHGSFLMGLALIFVCWTGQGIQSWQAQNNPGRLWTDGPFRRLGLALILCVSASCLNPHGPWIFRHVLRMAGNPALSMVLEWKPLGLYPIPILVGLPFVGSIIVLGLTQWLSPRPFSPTQWLMVVVFGMGACLQQRLLIWWIFLVPWIALPHWATLGGKALEELAVRLGPRSFRKTLLAGALFLAALMWSPAISWVLSGSPQPLNQSLSQGTVWELARQLANSQDSNRPWSPELAEVLRTTYPHRRFSGSIFTSETLGDYLTWALAPQLPISCYSHYHLFTQENWGENQRVLRGQSGWWDLLRQRQANLLVLEAEIYPQLCQLVREDPGWVVVRDEAGDPSKKTSYDRLFVAIRKKPIAE